MGEARKCDNCGEEFAPRREHARFCSARCRVAWNRGKLSYPPAEVSALQWSVTAMSDVVERLTRGRAWDHQRGFALVGEAVWWVTIVDATLVRHHPEDYDGVLDGYPLDERTVIEETLSGLRSVRNRVGHDVDLPDLVDHAAPAAGPGHDRITAWTWKLAPEPALAALQPRGQEWEMLRYCSYQEYLAGQTTGEVFGRASAFLERAASAAFAAAEANAPVPN